MKRQVRDSGSKPGLRQAFELHLAVAIGEEREHEERQPVRRRLVEGAEHARRFRRTGAAAQQIIGLVAAVAAEILVQQIHHRPQVTAFLDIDLEQVAHVVERGRGLAEMALLLDRSRLGIALDHDQTAKQRAVLARHFLPGGFAEMLAEIDLATFFRRRQQHAPAIFRHPHVIELGPALRIDRDRGAQIDQRLLKAFRPHVLPPAEVTRMPGFQRLQDAGVLGEPDIVRDTGRVIDIHDVHGTLLLFSKRAAYRIPASVRCHSGATRPPRRPRSAAGRSSSARRSAARRFSIPSSPARRSANSLRDR